MSKRNGIFIVILSVLLLGLAIIAYSYFITNYLVEASNEVTIVTRVENRLQVKDLGYNGYQLQPAYNLWDLK